MRTLDQWFAEYAVSHQNPKNKAIHYICVPAIYFYSRFTNEYSEWYYCQYFKTKCTNYRKLGFYSFAFCAYFLHSIIYCDGSKNCSVFRNLSCCKLLYRADFPFMGILDWRFCNCLDWAVLRS